MILRKHYEPRGIMPFGKYAGRPLSEVARDESYWQWFRTTPYARVNPELTADLEAAVKRMSCRRSVTIEFHEGGCIVYRPAVWAGKVKGRPPLPS